VPADFSQVAALVASMKATGPKVQAAAVKTVRATTNATAARARRNAPFRTGALRRSIRVRTEGQVRVLAKGLVEATADHAPMVEYGTARTDPQPFMNPAADSEQEPFYAEVDRALFRAAGLDR